MGKVAIYARVSTKDKQDFQRQINDLRPIIFNHNYKEDDIEVFAENISGYKINSERPEMELMFSKIHALPTYFDCIYITEISRLGRNPSDTRKTIDMLTDLKIPLYIQSLGQWTIMPDGKRNSIMNIILQVLMEFANSESEQMKARSRSGLLTSAKSGKAGGGRYLPYGFTKDKDKYLQIEPSEAEVVKEIFKLNAEGYGIRVISNILNERKVPTRTNISSPNKIIKFKKVHKNSDTINWSDKTIHDILRNSIYIGERKFKDEIIKVPAIIDEETFRLTQDRLVSKKTRNLQTAYTYLLKDIAICGCCGRNYMGRYKPTKQGDKMYLCTGRLKGVNCGNVGTNIKFLESVIYEAFIKSDLSMKFMEDVSAIKNEIESDINRLGTTMELALSNVVDKGKEQKRLLDLYLRGTINAATFEEKKNELESNVESLQDRVKLIQREIDEKKLAISKLNAARATDKMIDEAKNNRTELAVIVKQFLKNVIINKLNDRFFLATLVVAIPNVKINRPIKLLFDRYSTLGKSPSYKYQVFSKMENEPVFENNILKTEPQILLDSMLGMYSWFYELKKENILDMNVNQKELA